MRARAIEMIMCDFALDRRALEMEFGALCDRLTDDLQAVVAQFGDFVVLTERRLQIQLAGRPLTRLIASKFDAHMSSDARFSRAS